MFKTLKFFLQKMFSSKYVVSGKCNKCGDCCRQITFSVGDKLVTDEQEFLRMQKFEKKYKNFEINGKTDDGVPLFKCKHSKTTAPAVFIGFVRLTADYIRISTKCLSVAERL